MRTELLWVYEGLTEYLGFVLAARSGLYGPEISRDNWANIAAWSQNQTGRSWRALEDTAMAAPFSTRRGRNGATDAGASISMTRAPSSGSMPTR